MELKHFFRLITMSIFQSQVTYDKLSSYRGDKMSYDNQYFHCPLVCCKDGFSVSLQIHNGNYCSSENGYRTMGYDWQEVEFGFPSMNEVDMFKYSEMWSDEAVNFDVTETVGRIPIEVMQGICEKHGGIDWDVTVSSEKARQFVEGK